MSKIRTGASNIAASTELGITIAIIKQSSYGKPQEILLNEINRTIQQITRSAVIAPLGEGGLQDVPKALPWDSNSYALPPAPATSTRGNANVCER